VDDVAELAEGLLKVLNLRDAETRDHSQRVARYTMHLVEQAQAQGYHSFSRLELRDIKLGALLHDIGKVGIPDAILYKSESLTVEEWEIMRSHPLLGAEVLRGCPHFAGAIPIVRSHHERWDGDGYPDALAKHKIPLGARIFAIADALDAMGSDRPYRDAVPYDAIREEIVRMSGLQFDPALVRVFLTVAPELWRRLSLGSAHRPSDLPVASAASLPAAA
jgi:putative two-component system response regulator